MLRAVLFDLDGTLLDTYPAHFAAYRYMFGRYGIEIDEATFLATYSPNWYKTFEMMNLPQEQWEQANGYWMEENARHSPQPFDGVPELLERLARRYPLGVVTSGSKSRIESEMAQTGLREYFRVVISGDDVTRRKPDPQGLELALAALDVAAGEALYVGDAAADWEMARLAGMRFVGVPSKFGALGEGCELIAGICALEQALTDYPWGGKDFIEDENNPKD